MSEFSERRNSMDKNQSIPLSIERFAAYLDHNLPDGEMQAIDNVVNKDESLSQLVCLSKEADTVIAEWQPEDTPFDANSLDFELPKIESFNSSDNEWSFAAFGGVADTDASFVGDEDLDTDHQLLTDYDDGINQDDTLNINDDSFDFDDDTSSFDDTPL